MLDLLLPYVFISPLVVWVGWMLYGRRRPSPKPLSPAYRELVLQSLNLFRGCGLIAGGEVDDDVFLEIAEHYAESDGELAEAAGLLGEYARRHGPFANFHYRLLDPSDDEQIEAFRKGLPENGDRGRFAALTFEGSYWDGGVALTRLTEVEFDQLAHSLDAEQESLRWL